MKRNNKNDAPFVMEPKPSETGVLSRLPLQKIEGSTVRELLRVRKLAPVSLNSYTF